MSFLKDGEMAKLENCLLHKQEGLSLDFQNPWKKPGVAAYSYTPRCGGYVHGDRVISKVDWPASLSKFSERLCLKS